ncbi:hypothetical protein JDV02_008381 [Purpureocillium takamizusanense]|uniref:Major facilitator superfamily (MFS) profile domain-containing protein n=1 Tax=Purpureocillium takamizusanense TaxID=2060973 RepID=A0A9Q8QNP7_9HYPO|nr:uncharacterized protein JDV02_008381 [Purpureocillium takamizusanense]UNI22496.1 hypothetical protein JDV02_008381 [Purpureocillium takamizusanense]
MTPSAEATTSAIDAWADDSAITESPMEDDDARSRASEAWSDHSPERPLLVAPEAETWTPPPGFTWIQVAIMLNVFLNGFDGTITAATYAVISSEFDAANTASWLTTSYLVTAAAFQPLYGRVSDIFGRRVCFFVSTVTFAAGCLGCGIARDVVFLNIMRALTGFGGGGLMTMATIVNSDMIPFRKRGMYQAMQNGIFGFGAIAGASFGGTIADHIGWRWCFLLQVPISVMAFVVGWLVLRNQSGGLSLDDGLGAAWKRVDVSGALLLVAAISIQLVGLSLGGNELPWTSPWVIGSLVGSLALFAVFFRVEATTSAIPVIPLRMLKGRLPVATQIANVCAGMAAYAVRIPAYRSWSSALTSAVPIHVALVLPGRAARLGNQGWRSPRDPIVGDSYRRAGRRGRHVAMGTAHRPHALRRRPHDDRKRPGHVLWVHRSVVEVFRLHLPSKPRPGHRVSVDSLHLVGLFHAFRPRRLRVDGLPSAVPWYRMGRLHHVCHCANLAQRPLAGRFGRDTR